MRLARVVVQPCRGAVRAHVVAYTIYIEMIYIEMVDIIPVSTIVIYMCTVSSETLRHSLLSLHTLHQKFDRYFGELGVPRVP